MKGNETMKTNKTLRSVLAMLLAVVMVLAIAGCKPAEQGNNGTTPTGGNTVEKTYTYNTYTALSPSNWNELTYQDNNDTQIMNYLASSFFTFDFKYDEYGQIIDGEFEVEYEAATKLEDVSTSDRYAE